MKYRFFTLISVAAMFLLQSSAAWSKPQAIVECLGEHALCNATTDCKKISDTQANCACYKVSEIHLVETSKILDKKARLLTQKRCTTAHPCKAGRAPICRVIRNGQYQVGTTTYPSVSTYSYRGWCQTFHPVACEGQMAGAWADCMAAPCTVDPSNPGRPLNCQCIINNGPFVGINGSCETKPGEVMSTIPRAAWNFHEGAFSVPLPGNDYVNKGACKPLKSEY
jgi:hypothetical protein